MWASCAVWPWIVGHPRSCGGWSLGHANTARVSTTFLQRIYLIIFYNDTFKYILLLLLYIWSYICLFAESNNFILGFLGRRDPQISTIHMCGVMHIHIFGSYVDKFKQPCNRGTLLHVASVRRNWAAQNAFWSSSRTILSSSTGHVCLSGLWSTTCKSEWQESDPWKNEKRIK